MLIVRIWKNRLKILSGLWYRVFKHDLVEKVHKERLKICAVCPHIDEEGDNCYIPRTAPCCSKCGCELATKLRSLSSGCGDEENPRWHAVQEDE